MSTHAAEAKRLLGMAHHYSYGDGANPATALALATEAQAHATLALAAAQAADTDHPEQGIPSVEAQLDRLRVFLGTWCWRGLESGPGEYQAAASRLLADLDEAEIWDIRITETGREDAAAYDPDSEG